MVFVVAALSLRSRDQARIVRSVCLLELGAPREYIPASTTLLNTVGAKGAETEAVTAPEAAAEAGPREKESCNGASDDVAISSTEHIGPTPPEDASQSGNSSSSSDGAATAATAATAAVSIGAEVEPAGVAASALASSGGSAATSVVQGEDGKANTGGNQEAAAAAAAAAAEGAIASTMAKEPEQEEDKE